MVGFQHKVNYIKLLLIVSFFYLLPCSAKKVKNINVAIIQDGPSYLLDSYSKKFKENLKLIANGSTYKVEFQDYISMNWDIEEIRNKLEQALADESVNFIFLNGFIGSGLASSGEYVLTKPSISCFVHKTDIIKYPINPNAKKSLKENFNFIQSPQSFEREMEVFKESVGFNTIHVIPDAMSLILNPEIPDKVDAFNESGQGYEIDAILFEDSVKKLIDKIKDKKNQIEAIYLTSLPRMSFADREKLITAINEMKIPTFSGLGVQDLEIGALMTISPNLVDQISRRMALNIHQMIILDKKAEELSVFMPIQEKLSINALTGAQIDFYPDFTTELGAELLYKQEAKNQNTQIKDRLTLDQAMQIAGENNIDLVISSYEVKESGADKNRALSGMLPQASLDGNFTAIEKDRAQASSFNPRTSTSLGIGVTQMIFDDATITNFRRARKSYKGQKFNYDLDKYDVMADAGKRFLNYLAQIESLKIELDNLKIVQSNLDLAKNRFQVGRAGREEVYRWQSEKAQAKSSVISQEADLNSALVSLNQVLNVKQDSRWEIDVSDMNVNTYGPLKDGVSHTVNNRKDLEFLKDFFVEKAYEFSPELASLDKQIEAQQLRVNQLKRRFVLPSLSTSFNYDRFLQQDRLGEGADIQEEINENQLTFSINASYSILEGGAKFFDVQKEQAILDQLKNQRERSRQLIEQETLTTIYELTNTYPSIILSKQSAENAVKNLDVNRDKYARGAIDIITLLDAQNEAFTQNLNAAIAEFEYYADVVDLQRAISWFQGLKNKDDKKDFIKEFRKFKKRGNK